MTVQPAPDPGAGVCNTPPSPPNFVRGVLGLTARFIEQASRVRTLPKVISDECPLASASPVAARGVLGLQKGGWWERS